MVNCLQYLVSGQYEFSARLKHHSSTPGGQAYVYGKLPNLLCRSWKTENMSASGKIQGSGTINMLPSQSLSDPDHTLVTSESSSSEDESSSESEDSEDEIINFKPGNQKPTFKFEPSTLGASLPSFLAALKSSNDGLAAGVPSDQKFEISDSDDDEEHIEMNLGLGVLEHTSASADTPVSMSSKRDSPSDNDENVDDLEPYNPDEKALDQVASPSKRLKLLHTRNTQDATTESQVQPTNINTQFSRPAQCLVRLQIPDDGDLHMVLETPSGSTTIAVDDAIAVEFLHYSTATNSVPKEQSVPKYEEPTVGDTAKIIDSIIEELRCGNLPRFQVLAGHATSS